MSDQDRISPYNISTTWADKWWELKYITYQLGDLIQYQILWTNIIRITSHKVRRIIIEISEVKG